MASKRKGIVLGGVFVMVLALLLSVAAGGTAYAYRSAFYPGIRLAGVQLHGLTKEQGLLRVQAKTSEFENHAFKIVVPDVSKPIADQPGKYLEQEIAGTAKNLGLTFNARASVDAAWQQGHGTDLRTWVQQLFSNTVDGYAGQVSYSVDRKTLQEFIITKILPATGAPVPAKIVVNGSTVTIDSEKPGFSIDQTKLEDLLVASLETAQDTDTTYVRVPVSIANSAVTKKTLESMADTLTTLGDVPISLVVEDVTLKPNRAHILSWFTPVQNDKGEVSLTVSKEQISTYLKTQSKVDSTKSLGTVVKGMTTLLSKKTKEDLQTPVSLTLIAKQSRQTSPDEFTPNKYTGKYVEIDLSSQKLYLVETDRLVKGYTISSGKWATPTPLGEYSIRNKARRPLSRAYGLYLPYWQDFLNGEYGLHELPEWPNGYKEGENHLGIPVSHGCVRLGIGDAKEVYDWTELGTPVSIHQ